ncbi:MDR family MFS transporter [Photobacterium sanguinicancri]|uniref:MDR family MFS transporter n=1 Tax=Photobacterium sanguinicancri TaxID=875932 RepID=UPI003F5EC375
MSAPPSSTSDELNSDAKLKNSVPIADDEPLLKWSRLSHFTPTVWTVLIGTLMARTSYFMAWPFLIVILYKEYHADAITVGAMLASSAVLGVFAGLYSGFLSDKFGRKWVMISGCMVAAFCYAGIGFADSLWQFFVLIMCCGLMRPMIEAPAKAVISDNLTNLKDRELAMNVRYFIINLGGAIGPLIGITLAVNQPQVLFVVAGCVYVLFSLLYWNCFRQYPEVKHQRSVEVMHFGRTLRVVLKDRLFVKLLIANIIMMFVYGQYESSIPQIIVRSGLDNAAFFVSALVMVNTCTIILFQFPILRLLQRFPLFTRSQIGMGLMAMSQVGFLMVPVDWPVGWLIACFILSLGEVIAFPTLNVQIDKLAPAHLRGSYFGAAAIYSLGFALAPLVGGIMIQAYGASELFILCLGACAVMMILYRAVSKSESEKALDAKVAPEC